jgi:hypothetical protein
MVAGAALSQETQDLHFYLMVLDQVQEEKLGKIMGVAQHLALLPGLQGHQVL